MAVEVGLKNEEKPEEYVEDNFDKAIGHLYRAFFDIADWVSINLRESILEEFTDYSHDCIQAVIPEYYTDIVPTIEEISVKIADVRTGKDVTSTDTNTLMSEYEEILKKLHKRITTVRAKKSGIIECESRREKQENNKTLKQFLVGFLILLLGILLGQLFK